MTQKTTVVIWHLSFESMGQHYPPATHTGHVLNRNRGSHDTENHSGYLTLKLWEYDWVLPTCHTYRPCTCPSVWPGRITWHIKPQWLFDTWALRVWWSTTHLPHIQAMYLPQCMAREGHMTQKTTVVIWHLSFESMTEYYPPATLTGHVPAPVYGQGGSHDIYKRRVPVNGHCVSWLNVFDLWWW